MYCRIRIKGHLALFWQTWLDDLKMTHEVEGTTMLSGHLPDQAALYGVLLTIRRLGLPLLSLETSKEVASPAPLGFFQAARHGWQAGSVILKCVSMSRSVFYERRGPLPCTM